MIDLSTLSIDDLFEVKEGAEREIVRQGHEALEVMEERKRKIQSLLYHNAVSSDSPVSLARSKPIPPKYSHPLESGVTWTGRGKPPAWMKEWIDSGKDPNDLLITKMPSESADPE